MSQSENRFINRELSWLEFNQRVLDEAIDQSVPTLERMKFVAITASNLDEFFMVRVGGLQIMARSGSGKRDASGMTADQQLAAISDRTHKMYVAQYTCFLSEIESQLAEEGIRRVTPDSLNDSQFQMLEQVFREEIYSILTPMVVEKDKEFPLLQNRSMNVCVQLSPLEKSDNKEHRFAVIPFGQATSRFITLPSDKGYDYILLEDVVSVFIDRFFPGEAVLECVPFRITRNADLGVREDQAFDLLEGMEEVLDARKASHCVRLEVSDHISTVLLDFLRHTLDVDEVSLYAVPGPIDLSAFFSVTGLKGYDHLRYDDWPPSSSPDIDSRIPMFEILSQQDIMLYHPFESFDPVVRFIEEAAEDADVLAIKQTLYRTSKQSPIVAALKRAAENGKNVTALVELKARFDEERNINWARELEQSGVQVIYGVRGYKTHAKICVVVRRESTGIVRYAHFGTGNYNEATANLYTDVSFMTCDPELGADATAFFNTISGYSQYQDFHQIEVAPLRLREKILEMIESETERKRQGHDAHIMAKFNSLVDPKIIKALYEASQAGVTIELNVRGICCLRPGVPGLSETIRVVSIIDRFLEHSRIMYFLHGGDEKVFISSADWMPRNLDKRVELLTPIENDAIRNRLIESLRVNLSDNVKGRRILPDGGYERIRPTEGEPEIHSQRVLYDASREVLKQTRQVRRTEFVPHRAGTDA